ncbi:MAG TPA: deoxyguanosinetriphosphate triphosphohydrolase, partial [Acetobacteraceae bacterium]|nr:deoxyguanosinetriphosphate triphosphohydrolase [Acetobacteraceae bacterium]
AGAAVVAFSDPMREADGAIKGFLFPHMYRHARVMRIRGEAEQVLRDLFARFLAEPGAMPYEWSRDLDGLGEARLARRVADYIAGMTDGYALIEHRRLFAATPDLR